MADKSDGSEVVFLRLPREEVRRLDAAIAKAEQELGAPISRPKAIRALVARALGGPPTLLAVR
jgi:hypothetical protein